MIGLNVQELADWLSKIGFGGLLIFILAGFQQGWWVFGRERDELKAQISALTADRDQWKTFALSSMGAAERTARAMQTVLPSAEGAA